MRTRTLLATTALLGVLCLPAAAQQATDAIDPEAATEEPMGLVVPDRLAASYEAKQAGQTVSAANWMVSAAHPLAVDAGATVLAAGGTAADAMVAVQAVLGLVEPQSSGLGGGAFLVWYDAESGEITTLDGRETAPLDAEITMFQDEDGEPMGFFDAVVGGRSVGTPGTPRLMEVAHQRWGNQAWASLLDPAIGHATDGFPVSPRMASSIANDAERLSRFETTANYFLPGGEPLAEGTLLENPDYAATLTALAEGGADAFYEGPIAEAIVDTVQNAEGNPGVLALKDFEVYEIIERPAVCQPYRSHDVCGMGPPSSGALTVGQILGLSESFDLATLGPDDPQSWRVIGDASRLAFADRGRYMADSDYVPVPVEGLLEPDYLASRAELLQTDRALEEVEAGTPAYDHALLQADDISLELPSTSHISIVDQFGNALSMTTTIENGFGSRLMTNGFLLNNELTDFSFRTHSDGWPIANRLEPGKRPRSSMSPTIVLRDGEPVLVIGSPGGSRIIGYVAKTIIAHFDWDMDIQSAMAMPHKVNRFGTYDVEEGTQAEEMGPELEQLGYEVNVRGLTSGLHAIAISEYGLIGGADPRREGLAYGE